MTSYPAGPYIVEIPVITDNLSHSLTFNCDVIGTAVPGTVATDVELRSRGGTGIVLDAAVNDVWAILRSMYSTGSLVSSYTLWKQNTDTTERQFISAGTITPANGANPAVYIPANQVTITHRSAKGGIVKIVLLETIVTGNNRAPLVAFGAAAITALSAYMLGSDGWILSRDRSFPVAAMNVSLGQNEKIFKRRFRS